MLRYMDIAFFICYGLKYSTNCSLLWSPKVLVHFLRQFIQHIYPHHMNLNITFTLRLRHSRRLLPPLYFSDKLIVCNYELFPSCYIPLPRNFLCLLILVIYGEEHKLRGVFVMQFFFHHPSFAPQFCPRTFLRSVFSYMLIKCSSYNTKD